MPPLRPMADEYDPESAEGDSNTPLLVHLLPVRGLCAHIRAHGRLVHTLGLLEMTQRVSLLDLEEPFKTLVQRCRVSLWGFRELLQLCCVAVWLWWSFAFVQQHMVTGATV